MISFEGVSDNALGWNHPADMAEWARNPKQHDADA